MVLAAGRGAWVVSEQRNPEQGRVGGGLDFLGLGCGPARCLQPLPSSLLAALPEPSVLLERTWLLLPRKVLLDLVRLVALLLQGQRQQQKCDWPYLGIPGQQRIHKPGWQELRILPHLHL